MTRAVLRIATDAPPERALQLTEVILDLLFCILRNDLAEGLLAA